MNWLALDIGGANLKAADGRGFAASHSFALWRHSHQLADSLRTLIAEAPPADHLAVTMTGELADCYRTKAEGVTHILEAVQAAADHRHTRVYLTDGRLVTPAVACSLPLLVAASNWHALASFAGRFAKSGEALLLDIGTTTTDIVPLAAGRPCATGKTDSERLISGELVYTGVQRSPICAVTQTLPWRGVMSRVAQELFATTLDAYLLLGDLPENPQQMQTADGRPATRACALDRMARMVCGDETSFNEQDALQAAALVREAQLKLLHEALRSVLKSRPAAPTTIVISGKGEFLARRLIGQVELRAKVISLREQLGGAVSRCAPAHALAVLASEAG